MKVEQYPLVSIAPEWFRIARVEGRLHLAQLSDDPSMKPSHTGGTSHLWSRLQALFSPYVCQMFRRLRSAAQTSKVFNFAHQCYTNGWRLWMLCRQKRSIPRGFRQSCGWRSSDTSHCQESPTRLPHRPHDDTPGAVQKKDPKRGPRMSGLPRCVTKSSNLSSSKPMALFKYPILTHPDEIRILVLLGGSGEESLQGIMRTARIPTSPPLAGPISNDNTI